MSFLILRLLFVICYKKIYIQKIIISLQKYFYSVTSFMERLSSLNNQLKGTGKTYQYTTDFGCLTKEQRDFYQENGYLVIQGFLKDDNIARWKERFLQYCDKKLPNPPGMQVVKDIALVKKNKGKQLKGQASITKLQDFQFDDVLQSYCKNPQLIPYLKSFCGENIKSVHTMFINKPPGMGGSSRHPMHQDLAYFPFGPADRIVAAWASLQDATKQNGALNIIPKSHKGNFFDHEYPDWNGLVNKAYFGIKEYEKFSETKKIELLMKKGDIVFFHPLLIHGSGENKSQGYRKSMCCHFAASDCKYINVEGKVQQLVAKQIMTYISKILPQAKDYTSVWKMKSQLVAGKQFPDGL